MCKGALECVSESLADRLECGPGVRPTDRLWRFIVEDVVAEIVERRLRV